MPLTAGLNQKSDPQTIAVPELTRAVDIRFDELGGFQTRYPYSTTATSFDSGGSISNVRKLIANGDETLMFTKTGLYSYFDSNGTWVSRGTHLAVKVEENPVFVSTGDQWQCDRAELNGVIVYAWNDNNNIYAAARDSVTGSVVVAPTLVSAGYRPRLLALDSYILLFTVTDSAGSPDALVVRRIDPALVATGLAASATTVLAGASFNVYYDVCRWIGSDAALVAMRRDVTTSYEIAKVTSALAVTSSTKGRTCDGPIAVSCSPSGTQVQVVRANGTDIQGDLLTISTLADVYTAQAIGTVTTTVGQIAAAHRSVQNGGQYRCYVFWDFGEYLDTTEWYSKSNWVDTGNSLGTQANFVRHLAPASRAFDYDGSVYVWGVFAGVSNAGLAVGGLQNTYFLYRDDQQLVAKAVGARAGGYDGSVGGGGAAGVGAGFLPHVALISGTTTFAWCGTERRAVGAATGLLYSDRGPRDIAFTFDSNDARRCARLGRTLYVTGGELLQYDGVQLTESGFHVYPWATVATQQSGANVAAGTYSVKWTWRWDNAQGEIDRSTTASYATVTVSGGGAPDEIQSTGVPLFYTHKTSRPIAVEVWRTVANPSDVDAPYYLVSSKDPTATGDNGYLANSTTTNLLTFSDDYADATIASKETNIENGGILENIAPPPSTLICASDTRLFLAGIPGEPGQVWYSKQRGDGEVAAFNDALVAVVPRSCGAITGLAYFQDTPIAFCERGVCLLLNDGFDNAGGGQNYIARQTPGNIGCVSQESIAVTDKGVIFKSPDQGWQMLNRAWQTEYIGAGVSDYDDEDPVSIDVVGNEVRVLTEDRMLVLNTLAWEAYGRPTWAEWTIADAVTSVNSATLGYCYATSSAFKQELVGSYFGCDYGMDVEFGWLDLAQMQAFGRVRNIRIRGEYKAAHTLQLRLARDWWADGVDTYFQTKTWTATPTTTGGKLELDHGPSIQQVDALKLRITADPTTTGESLKLSAIEFEFGFRQWRHHRVPAAQKQ